MESWTSGPHLFEFEPPDIFHCHVRGPIEESDTKETVRITIDNLGKKRGIRVYFVAHMEVDIHGSPFTVAARTYLGVTKPNWKAIVVVGGNAFTRMAASIIARGQSLLSDNKMPTKMVKSIDDARTYIAELRAKEPAHTAT